MSTGRRTCAQQIYLTGGNLISRRSTRDGTGGTSRRGKPTTHLTALSRQGGAMTHRTLIPRRAGAQIKLTQRGGSLQTVKTLCYRSFRRRTAALRKVPSGGSGPVRRERPHGRKMEFRGRGTRRRAHGAPRHAWRCRKVDICGKAPHGYAHPQALVDRR